MPQSHFQSLASSQGGVCICISPMLGTCGFFGLVIVFILLGSTYRKKIRKCQALCIAAKKRGVVVFFCFFLRKLYNSVLGSQLLNLH